MLSCSLPLGRSMLSCSLPLGCSILFMLAAARTLDALMLAAARMLEALHARYRLHEHPRRPKPHLGRAFLACCRSAPLPGRISRAKLFMLATVFTSILVARSHISAGLSLLAAAPRRSRVGSFVPSSSTLPPSLRSSLAALDARVSSFTLPLSLRASLAAYSSALRSSFTLPLSLRSSLAACLSALRASLAACLSALRASLAACSRALRASLALPLSHLWTYLCASTDCSAARAGLPSLFFRVRRAAVDAHGAYATLWTRTGPMLHSPPFTSCQFTGCGSLSRAAARGASWRGCTARTLCSGSLLLRGGAGLLAGVLFSFQAVYFLVTSRRFRGSPLTRSSCRSRLPAARCLSHPSLNFRFFFDLRCEMPLWVLFSPVPRFSPGFRFSGGRPAAIWLLNRPGPPWDWNPRARLGTETSLVKGTF
jgi:hypothetical protein